jgi:membrane protein
MRMPHALGWGGAAGWLSRTSLAGWKDIALRTRTKFGVDNIPMIAAGVTFYTILALFPGLAALISIYGLFADASQVPQHVQALSHLLPGGAVKVVGDQMQALASANREGLSLTFAISLIISFWSANGAIKAMMTGLNMAFEKREERGYLKQTVISLAFTFGFLLFGVLTLVVLGLPPAIGVLAGPEAAAASTVLCWAVLLLGLAIGLALLYRYGPSRGPVRLQWISWGNTLAVIVWLIVSALFTLYVANFGHYNKTYGSLGAAVGFMTWIYLSSMVFLGGAELNAQVEREQRGATTAP